MIKFPLVLTQQKGYKDRRLLSVVCGADCWGEMSIVMRRSYLELRLVQVLFNPRPQGSVMDCVVVAEGQYEDGLLVIRLANPEGWFMAIGM